MNLIHNAELNLTTQEREDCFAIIEYWLGTRELSDTDMIILFRLYVNKIIIDHSKTFTCSSCRIEARQFWRDYYIHKVGREHYLSIRATE
mgnify:CR=1 FL=1